MFLVVMGVFCFVCGEFVFVEVLFVLFIIEFNKVGDVEVVVVVRAFARRDVVVFVGGVLSFVSNIVVGFGGILYCVGVILRCFLIMCS